MSLRRVILSRILSGGKVRECPLKERETNAIINIEIFLLSSLVCSRWKSEKKNWNEFSLLDQSNYLNYDRVSIIFLFEISDWRLASWTQGSLYLVPTTITCARLIVYCTGCSFYSVTDTDRIARTCMVVTIFFYLLSDTTTTLSNKNWVSCKHTLYTRHLGDNVSHSAQNCRDIIGSQELFFFAKNLLCYGR